MESGRLRTFSDGEDIVKEEASRMAEAWEDGEGGGKEDCARRGVSKVAVVLSSAIVTAAVTVEVVEVDDCATVPLLLLILCRLSTDEAIEVPESFLCRVVPDAAIATAVIDEVFSSWRLLLPKLSGGVIVSVGDKGCAETC